MSPLPLSREHIEAIQARAEKATPGEWGFAAQNGMRGHCDMAQVYNSTGHALADIEPTPDEAEATATANFIAHARTDIPALCQQALWAIELEAEVARLQNLVPHLCENAEMQSYTGTVEIMPPETMRRSDGRGICVDVCLALEVTHLWRRGINTTGCCCGHGRQHGYIGVTDECIPAMQALGYQVIVRPEAPERLDSFYPKTKLVNYEQLQSELTATRKALEEERERIAKHILEQREGGHCGEGSMEIIARQRNNADLKRAAEFVRLVPAPQVKG